MQWLLLGWVVVIFLSVCSSLQSVLAKCIYLLEIDSQYKTVPSETVHDGSSECAFVSGCCCGCAVRVTMPTVCLCVLFFALYSHSAVFSPLILLIVWWWLRFGGSFAVRICKLKCAVHVVWFWLKKNCSFQRKFFGAEMNVRTYAYNTFTVARSMCVVFFGHNERFPFFVLFRCVCICVSVSVTNKLSFFCCFYRSILIKLTTTTHHWQRVPTHSFGLSLSHVRHIVPIPSDVS